MKFLTVFSAFVLSLVGGLSAAQPISPASKLLSQCEFTYLYAGQLLQLRNNEGAAKAMVSRSTMLTVANFIHSEENGVIAKWKIREFTLLRDPLKQDFDSGKRDALSAAGVCDREAMPIAIQIRDTGETLWGKTFDELQIEFFDRTRKLIGL